MHAFGRSKDFVSWHSKFSFFPSVLVRRFVKWKSDYLIWLQGSAGLTSSLSSVTQNLENALLSYLTRKNSYVLYLCCVSSFHWSLIKHQERGLFCAHLLYSFWWLAAPQEECFNKYPKIYPFFRREWGDGMGFLFLVVLADLAWSDTEQKQ